MIRKCHSDESQNLFLILNHNPEDYHPLDEVQNDVSLAVILTIRPPADRIM